MTAFPILLILLLAAAGIGRRALQLLRISPPTRLERTVFAAGLGLGVVAYAVFALGMLGLLRLAVVLPVLVLLTGAAWPGLRGVLQDLRPPYHRPSPLTVAACVLLAMFGFAAAVACHVPPGPHEWDVQAYHLAAPKIHLEHGRIDFLPTQHQSNFPFLQQMLFLLGLMLQGPELAALTHFATAAVTVAALFAIGRRHFAPAAGTIAAVAFASTPIVLWEAGIAYIDVAQAMYALLATGAVLDYRGRREPRLLALAGAFIGFALGVKTLSLIPFALLALFLAVERVPVRHLLAYTACAVVVGCPFYVKTWAVTGNPVYPFAYRVFGGRYWNQAMAGAYATEQRSFGLNRTVIGPQNDLQLATPPWSAPTPLERLRDLVLNPFKLVAVPRIYYNWNDISFFSQLGFLFLALPPLLILARNASSAARWCAALLVLWFAAWSVTMQYVRYLIPLLGPLYLIGGEGAVRAARDSHLLRVLVAAAVALQVGIAAWVFLPQVPQQLAIATSAQAREEYLGRSVNHYASLQWLNRNTPPDAGVVLFEETRGFYLDRPYLWGNSPHSLYIPYEHFANGRAMADWFLERRYRYGLINLRFSGLPLAAQDYADLHQAAATGTAPTLALRWYSPTAGSGERWRRLLGEALADGSAVILPEGSFRDVVVLEFRPRRQPPSG